MLILTARKKCDETYPVCSSCRARNEQCCWRSAPSEKTIHSVDDALAVAPVGLRPSYSLDPDASKYNGFVDSSVTVVSRTHTSFPGDILRNRISPRPAEPQDLLNDPSINDFFDSYYPWPQNGPENKPLRGRDQMPYEYPMDEFLWSTPSVPPPLSPVPFLDPLGRSFINYFQSKVVNMVTVGMEKNNYLIHTYYKLMQQPAIAYALAAWGGYYLRGSADDDHVKFHLNQSLRCIKTFVSSRHTFDQHDNLLLLSFYMILLAIRVCTGDVHNWKVMHNKAREVIVNAGGIERFCNDLNRSNDIKFLLSSFQYHDVMSSSCSKHGTVFSLDEYQKIFPDDDDVKLFGVDPLQGCNQQVYLLLGELMSIKAQVYSTLHYLDVLISEGARDNYHSLKMANMRFIEDKLSSIEPTLLSLRPNKIQLDMTESEYELHEMVCQLYILVCRLYSCTYIKQIPPKSYEIQRLLVETTRYVDELIDTKMNIILCFPLLMCGISSVGKFDREMMEMRFIRLAPTPIANMNKALAITKEAWKRNPNGDFVIDWADICQEFNWEFSPC